MITFEGAPKTGEIVLIAGFIGKVKDLRGAIRTRNKVINIVSESEVKNHEDLLWKYLSNSQKN